MKNKTKIGIGVVTVAILAFAVFGSNTKFFQGSLKNNSAFRKNQNQQIQRVDQPQLNQNQPLQQANQPQSVEAALPRLGPGSQLIYQNSPNVDRDFDNIVNDNDLCPNSPFIIVQIHENSSVGYLGNILRVVSITRVPDSTTPERTQPNLITEMIIEITNEQNEVTTRTISYNRPTVVVGDFKISLLQLIFRENQSPSMPSPLPSSSSSPSTSPSTATFAITRSNNQGC